MPKQDKLGMDSARLTSGDSVQTLYETRLLRLIGAGTRITCLEGAVLITAYDRQEDFALHSGDRFIVPNRGLVLIEAIDFSRIHIERMDAKARQLSTLVARILVRLARICLAR